MKYHSAGFPLFLIVVYFFPFFVFATSIGTDVSVTGTFSSTGTATSSFANGLNITGGCFSISNTCVGAGSGTVGSGTAGYFPYYASNGTGLSATSTLFLNTTTGKIGIGTTTPTSALHFQENDSHLISFTPRVQASTSGNFNFSSYLNANVNDTSRANDVYRIGYNMTPNGSLENQNDGAFGIEFENHYAPDTANKAFENHFVFKKKAGGEVRWITTIMYNSGPQQGRLDLGFGANKINYQNGSSTNQYIVMQPNSDAANAGGAIQMQYGTTLDLYQNNYSGINQYNVTADALRSLIYFDSQNHVLLGGSGDPTKFANNAYFSTDGANDIGQAYWFRPRDIYAKRQLLIQGTSAIGSNILAIFNYSTTSFSGTNDSGAAHLIEFDGTGYNGNYTQSAGVKIGLVKDSSWNTTAGGSVDGSFVVQTVQAGTMTERMRLTSAGRLGIGTSTPNTMLHVSAGASATTTVDFGDQYLSSSKSCFNVKNTVGTAISFYFVGTTMVVESSRCK